MIGQVIAGILLVIGIVLCMVAFFSVMGIFFPRRIAKTHMIAETMTGRSFVIGLVNFAFWLAVGIGIMALANALKLPPLRIVAVIVGIPLALSLIFGITGMIQLVGAKLSPEAAGLKRTAWGTVGLTLACVLPYVGWFGLSTFVSLLGLGAFLYSFFYKERPAPLPGDTVQIEQA